MLKKMVFTLLLFGTMAFLNPLEILRDSIDVLNEMMGSPDAEAFAYLLKNAKGIAIFPSVYKVGLVFGVEYGEGFLLKRDEKTGEWFGPLFLKLAGGSWGYQVGIKSTSLLLVVMNEKGIEGFMKDNFTLGGDVSVSAGPLGRDISANVDYRLKASIYSYSLSKGFFLGLSLEGAYISIDEENNFSYYKVPLTAEEILTTRIEKKPELRKLIQLLEKLMRSFQTRKDNVSKQIIKAFPFSYQVRSVSIYQNFSRFQSGVVVV